MSFDVAGVVGAISGQLQESGPESLGRVSVQIRDDRENNRPPDVTDPADPEVLQIERTSPRPVSVYDVSSQSAPAAPPGGVQLAYTAPFASRIVRELDVAVEPRANIVFGGDVSGVGYGALVRFGRNLASPREKSSRWYAFVGVDAQALTWSLDPGLDQTDGLRLEHKQMIGDAQAGVAVRVGGGDLSFGYVHREVRVELLTQEDVSRVERFVGVSYTIRR
jgi:hypothetical protein